MTIERLHFPEGVLLSGSHQVMKEQARNAGAELFYRATPMPTDRYYLTSPEERRAGFERVFEVHPNGTATYSIIVPREGRSTFGADKDGELEFHDEGHHFHLPGDGDRAYNIGKDSRHPECNVLTDIFFYHPGPNPPKRS